MKKPLFFNSYFQNSFQKVICRVLKSANFVYKNDGPINIMQDVKRTLVLLLFSLGFYVKLYEGTINFQYIFLKFISGSRTFSSFMISNLLLLKWRLFKYNWKFEKKPYFLMFGEAFFKNVMKRLPFFKYKFQKFTSLSAILQSYRILKFLLLKWRSLQHNIKFEMKTSFIIVLTRLLSKRLW